MGEGLTHNDVRVGGGCIFGKSLADQLVPV